MSDTLRSAGSRLLTQAANELAADSRSLDGLKRDAQRDPQGAVRKAAQQFEALFMQMVLKSMREAMPKSGLFDSPSQDLYTGMLDQQMATKMSQSGTGLADVIVRQLTRHLPAAAPNATAAPPSSGADPSDAAAQARTPRSLALSRYNAVARAAIERPAAIAADSAADPATDPVPGSINPAINRAVDRQFINKHWDSALAAQRITGVPAKFVISQAALESGWGKAEIRSADGIPSYNLFGIKATAGWQGRTVDVVTTEYDNGVAKKVVEKFRAYNNYREAFGDWARLMAGNPRYAGVLAQGRDAQGFAHGLQRAGYATDPAYGSKLAGVIASVGAVLRSS